MDGCVGMVDGSELVGVRLGRDVFDLFAGCNGLVAILFDSSRS